ncbi:MAG: hypothetical protein C0602_03260 [Denitrovibrio sp.]|nr:MAG: hypothetical protein C0602_03260 [Denitrovibrio sp.]
MDSAFVISKSIEAVVDFAKEVRKKTLRESVFIRATVMKEETRDLQDINSILQSSQTKDGNIIHIGASLEGVESLMIKNHYSFKGIGICFKNVLDGDAENSEHLYNIYQDKVGQKLFYDYRDLRLDVSEYEKYNIEEIFITFLTIYRLSKSAGRYFLPLLIAFAQSIPEADTASFVEELKERKNFSDISGNSSFEFYKVLLSSLSFIHNMLGFEYILFTVMNNMINSCPDLKRDEAGAKLVFADFFRYSKPFDLINNVHGELLQTENKKLINKYYFRHKFKPEVRSKKVK